MMDENYYFLLRRAKKFIINYPLRILSYCLMPTHYHFFFGVDEDDALAPFLRRLFSSYTQAFNLQEGRTGTLFEGLSKSKLVDDSSYALRLVRYLHLNPVRAGLVNHPNGWAFSDYLAWTGQQTGEFYDKNFGSMLFSNPDQYRLFVDDGLEQDEDDRFLNAVY